MKKIFATGIIFATLFILISSAQATSVTFSSITYDDTTADVGTTRTITITMRSSASGESVNVNTISISGGLTEVSTPATPFTVTYSGVSKDYVVRSDTAGTYTFAITVVDTGGTSYTSSSYTLEYVDPASFTLSVTEYPSGSYSANSQFGVVTSIYNSLSSTKTRNVTLWFDSAGFTVSGDPQSALVSLPASSTTQKIWNTTVGSASAGTHYAYIRLGDSTQAASYAFTIPSTATTTTTSAAAAGGSSGSTTTETGKITKSYTSITPETPKTITSTDLVGSGTKLTEVYFEVAQRATDVEISISGLSGQPSNTGSISGVAYNFISIDKKNLDDSNVKNAKIKFKVEKSWLTQNGIDYNTLALYRYANGQWNKLTTQQTSSDADNYYFESTTPGFSYFAVIGQSLATTTTTTAITAATTTTVAATTTTTAITKVAIENLELIIGIIIVIIVIIALLFFLKNKMKKI